MEETPHVTRTRPRLSCATTAKITTRPAIHTKQSLCHEFVETAYKRVWKIKIVKARQRIDEVITTVTVRPPRFYPYPPLLYSCHFLLLEKEFMIRGLKINQSHVYASCHVTWNSL